MSKWQTESPGMRELIDTIELFLPDDRSRYVVAAVGLAEWALMMHNLPERRKERRTWSTFKTQLDNFQEARGGIIKLLLQDFDENTGDEMGETR